LQRDEDVLQRAFAAVDGGRAAPLIRPGADAEHGIGTQFEIVPHIADDRHRIGDRRTDPRGRARADAEHGIGQLFVIEPQIADERGRVHIDRADPAGRPDPQPEHGIGQHFNITAHIEGKDGLLLRGQLLGMGGHSRGRPAPQQGEQPYQPGDPARWPQPRGKGVVRPHRECTLASPLSVRANYTPERKIGY